MDSIGDMFTRIRNALQARKETVSIPASKMKVAIANLLVEEGFIQKVEASAKAGKKSLKLFLKYRPDRTGLIRGIKRVSKPGRRVYIGHEKIRKIQAGFGISLISTPKGIMTGAGARSSKLGGEVLGHIW